MGEGGGAKMIRTGQGLIMWGTRVRPRWDDGEKGYTRYEIRNERTRYVNQTNPNQTQKAMASEKKRWARDCRFFFLFLLVLSVVRFSTLPFPGIIVSHPPPPLPLPLPFSHAPSNLSSPYLFVLSFRNFKIISILIH